MFAKDRRGNDSIMSILIFNYPDIEEYLLFIKKKKIKNFLRIINNVYPILN